MRTKDMTTGSPIRLILLFALPLLGGSLFQQLYNFVDTAIVGKYVGSDALAAVGTTSSVNMLLVALAMGLTNGSGIVISQCFGAKKYDEMKTAVTSMFCVLAVLAAVIAIVGNLLAVPILHLLGAPEDILPNSAAYMRIILGLCFGTVIYNCCSAILRNLGNSKTPLVMLIISSITNIILDLVFVLKFGLGVHGVALATVISQILSAFLCAMYIMRHRRELMLENLPRRPQKDMIIKIIKTGFPAAFQSCMISLGGMCVQSLVNSFGKNAMAAYTSVQKIDSLSLQILVSLAIALSVYSGQNMGAGNIERIRKGLRQTLAVSVPVCAFLGAIMLIFGKNILTIFLDPAEASESIQIGARYLSIIGVGYIIAGIMQSYQQLLRGCGDVNICMIAGLSELGARVAFSYIFVRIWGLTGIWIAIPLSWGCGCIIPVIRYYSGKWQNKRLVK